jgi:hypothetical protein
LKIPDTLAGKKIKCPKCQAVVTVPATSAVAPGPAPKSPARAAAGSAISKAPTRPPTKSAPPALRKRPIHDEDEDDREDSEDDDSEDEAPRKKGKKGGKRKKKQSPVLLYSIIGGSVLLVALLVGGYFLFFNNSGGTKTAGGNNPGGGGLPGGNPVNVGGDDQKFLPENAQVILSVRVAGALASPAMQKLQQEIPMLATALNDPQIPQNLGAAPTDVESVLVGFAAQGIKQEGGGVVRLSKDVTIDPIVKSMTKGGMIGTVQEGTYTIHHGTGFDKSAVCLLDPKTLVVGSSPEIVQAALKRTAPNLPPGMKAALDAADLSSSLVMVIDTANIGKQAIAAGGQQAQGFAHLVPEHATIVVKMESNIEVKVNATFKDDKASKDAGDLVNGGVAAMKLQQTNTPQVKAMLDTVKINNTGPQLIAEASVDPGVLAAVVKDGMKAGGPGLPFDFGKILKGAGGP